MARDLKNPNKFTSVSLIVKLGSYSSFLVLCSVLKQIVTEFLFRTMQTLKLAFCTFLSFQVNSMSSKGQDFQLLLNITFIIVIKALECPGRLYQMTWD